MAEGYLASLLPTIEEHFADRAKADLYFDDPELWALDYLGLRMWEAQADVALTVAANRNTSVKAGHEVGKSWLAGVLICWWISTRAHLPGGAFVVSTAPSTSQINAIVWKEVRRVKALADERYAEGLIDHPLPGYVTADAHWRLDNGIEIGYGRKPPEGKDDTMSGIHARYVLAVGDESVGLSETLITDLGNLTGNETSRRVLFCNPTNPLSYVATLHKSKSLAWIFKTISVFESPNFHGGGLCDCERHIGQPKGLGFSAEMLESLVDQSYVDDRLADWGSVDSPQYISRILGEFAFSQGATIISMEDMAVGLDCKIVPTNTSRPVLGVDVSRSEHGDMNTVYSNELGRLRFVAAWNDPNAMRTAERIVNIALETGAYEVRIDTAGLGGPIYDRVVDLAEGRFAVVAMLGGAQSPARMRWYNARAFWFHSFGEALRNGLIDIDPEDEKLQEELLGIEYKQQTHGIGAILIESKDDMRKRGVGSPDYADAAIYATADVTAAYGPQPGDIVAIDPWENRSRAGMPI